MIRPRLIYRVGILIVLAIWVSSFATLAEQPPVVSPPPAELKAAPPPRAKPQIIYHLPRTSSYAATLHSQAKTQSNALPIDSSMPPSLQMSRAAANEAAARAQQEQQSAPKVNASRKRPKLQSNQSQMRKQGPGKARGPSSRGNKSRKK